MSPGCLLVNFMSVSVCMCVFGEKAFPASTFMCAHEKIYGLPENNGLVELVQERNFLLILVIFIIIHFLFFIAGWNWTNNLPSNTGQQSVVVVKKSTYSGEKLIYVFNFLVLNLFHYALLCPFLWDMMMVRRRRSICSWDGFWFYWLWFTQNNKTLHSQM